MSTISGPASDMLVTVKSREVQRGMLAEMRGDRPSAARHFLAAAHLELVLAADFDEIGDADLAVRSRLSAASCFWRAGDPLSALLVLRLSAAPKGPKRESPGGGNPACGVGPGDPIRMRIRPALKGRNTILDHKPVLPLQGVAILNTGPNSQGGALGWHVTAPSGRDSKSATSKVRSWAYRESARVAPGSCRDHPGSPRRSRAICLPVNSAFSRHF